MFLFLSDNGEVTGFGALPRGFMSRPGLKQVPSPVKMKGEGKEKYLKPSTLFKGGGVSGIPLCSAINTGKATLSFPE